MSEMRYRAVPEKTLFIDLPDSKGLKIKAILRGSFKNPLVILVHGRPGSGNDLLEYLGARYLYEQGFSSLRIFLYDEDPRSRNMFDCTLQTHANDLDTVIQYAKQQKTPKIFATGHSYGGPTILLAKEKFDSVVLWDPSHGSLWQEKAKELKQTLPEKELGDYIIGLIGPGWVFGKKMVDDETHWGDTTYWAARKTYPVKIINASEGVLAGYGKRYIEVASEPKEYLTIPGAGHMFDESDEITLRLFKETAEWFNRFKS